MDIKNTAITATLVIQSLVKLLENEDVDISSVKFKVGSESNGYESPEFELEKLIDLAIDGLDGIKQTNGVPEGFVLVSKDKITCFWQDADEPENFCKSPSDFDSLGDCIDLGEIIEINKHTQANIKTEKLYGTWFADALFPSEKANFYVGTQKECYEIIAKNKAMIEAQEQGRD